jgi:NADPH-dependent 2,4-dienoyl-CoA reductase/sulfur reductase-like enzyme
VSRTINKYDFFSFRDYEKAVSEVIFNAFISHIALSKSNLENEMVFEKKYDVVVAGAGVAGVAAALAAARRGHSVALIEKQTIIGGLATSGLIFVYLPLCDGNGRQVTFGISEELLK